MQGAGTRGERTEGQGQAAHRPPQHSPQCRPQRRPPCRPAQWRRAGHVDPPSCVWMSFRTAASCLRVGSASTASASRAPAVSAGDAWYGLILQPFSNLFSAESFSEEEVRTPRTRRRSPHSPLIQILKAFLAPRDVSLDLPCFAMCARVCVKTRPDRAR